MFKKFTPVFLLLFIVVFAFFIRVYFPYNIVFTTDGIVEYGDDAIYHMRFLENMLLGGHFPSFFYFDPFVNFPHGLYASLAPFFDFFLAVVIWLVSFGKPTAEIINKVAPFYPAVLGSIVPIIVYFISKAIWKGNKIPLLSALFASISSPILFRSLLAMNDHHVAEVLFSSLAIMFLLYVLMTDGKKKWLYVFLCGLSMGLYLLTWTGAILFFFIIFVFLVIYYLIEFISKRPCNWILAAGAIIFWVPFLMVLPFLGHPNLELGIYNTYHLLCFALGLFGFLSIFVFGAIVKIKSLKRWTILFLLAGSLLAFLLLLKIFSPYLFEKIIILSNGLNANGLTSVDFKNYVGEMRFLGFQGAVKDFGSLFFFYLIGFALIIYDYMKQKKPEYLLLIIWSAFTFLITGIIPLFGQQRFGIYLGINVAVLSAFVIVKGFEIGIKALRISSRMEESNSLRHCLLVGSLAILAGLVLFIFYPFPFNIGAEWPNSLPANIYSIVKITENPVVLMSDLHGLLAWLKEKTPDPGINLYDLYQGPKIDEKTGKVSDYKYPEKSYGVLANWDYGHAVEYYAQRPVIANPFQVGIGKKENGKVEEIGVSVFFLEDNENIAASYLDDLRARYVITDDKFSSLRTFSLMVNWIQGNSDGYFGDTKNLTKGDNSMLVRLHYLDGSQASIKSTSDKKINLTLAALHHFRLLYESETTTRILPVDNSLKEIKAAKVFEYVKGVKIKGWAAPGAEVAISTKITTNRARDFVYESSIKAGVDGSFDFIVPYSTGKQEMSDVSASDYTIKIGNWERKVKVSEEDVLQGKIIEMR